jgi:hypothetical protein
MYSGKRLGACEHQTRIAQEPKSVPSSTTATENSVMPKTSSHSRGVKE